MRRRATIEERPRFRLRRAPIREIQVGIVRAGDQGLNARALLLRQLAPRVEAWFTLRAGSCGNATRVSRVDVDRADITAIGGLLRPQPVIPCSTLLLMTIAPLVDGWFTSESGVSQRIRRCAR